MISLVGGMALWNCLTANHREVRDRSRFCLGQYPFCGHTEPAKRLAQLHQSLHTRVANIHCQVASSTGDMLWHHRCGYRMGGIRLYRLEMKNKPHVNVRCLTNSVYLPRCDAETIHGASRGR